MQQQGRYEAPVPLFLRPAAGLALCIWEVPPRNMSQREEVLIREHLECSKMPHQLYQFGVFTCMYFGIAATSFCLCCRGVFGDPFCFLGSRSDPWLYAETPGQVPAQHLGIPLGAWPDVTLWLTRSCTIHPRKKEGFLFYFILLLIPFCPSAGNC